MVTLMPRKPGMSRADFIEYYEKSHVPLSFSLFPQIVKMVRNYPSTDNFHYIASAKYPKVPFDAVVEHWFADQTSFDEMMAQFANSPEKFRQLSEDEAKFCDKERTIMFMVEEHQTQS
jgi:uncharacterized protein (TIGR02118 family)